MLTKSTLLQDGSARIFAGHLHMDSVKAHSVNSTAFSTWRSDFARFSRNKLKKLCIDRQLRVKTSHVEEVNMDAGWMYMDKLK
jgi:hypothetical protein